MEKEKFSYPVSLRRMQITDKFWKNEMELVRTEVIPYQWNALNDKVEGAAPSYCMHNFKVAQTVGEIFIEIAGSSIQVRLEDGCYLTVLV